jgi:co-chaperonin GroES (HSP10)
MATGTVRLRNDNVLVRIERQQWLSTREQLIHLPDTARPPEANEALIAVVEAVGPGYYPEVRVLPDRPRGNEKHDDLSPRHSSPHFVPTTVRPGDRVLLDGRWAGQDVTTDTRIVREAEILGVIEDESTPPPLDSDPYGGLGLLVEDDG